MAKLKATSVAGDLTVTGKVTSTVAGATTSTIGTVKLNNATNSTSTTEAATAAAVKATYDLANRKSDSYTGNDGGGFYNQAVISYRTGASETTGILKVSLPQGFVNTMISFDVYVYDYSEHTRQKYSLSGYSFGSPAWHNTSYMLEGYIKNSRVRFGYDGSKCCVLIGDTTSKWSYTHVVVTNVQTAHSVSDSYGAGWGVSFLTSETGLQNIVSPVNLTGKGIPVASGTTTGIVKLIDSVSSTSTTDAATPNSVKKAYDLANGKAPASHGNHVPTTQTANNAIFLRNDNNWATVTPANIGAVPTSDVAEASTASKIPKRTSSGDINARLFKSEFANQTTISGAMAFRVNNSSDNFIRFCSDTTAIRNWIGAAASSHGHSNATTSASGFMSNTDKSKLDGIASGANNYSHPNDANTRHVTDSEKGNWNGAVTKANDWNSFKTNGGTIGGDIAIPGGGISYTTSNELLLVSKDKTTGIGLQLGKTGEGLWLTNFSTKNVLRKYLDSAPTDIGEPKIPFSDIYLSGLSLPENAGGNHSSSGYSKLPNGLYVQWSNIYIEQPCNGNWTTYSFPISFPKLCLSMSGTCNYDGNSCHHPTFMPHDKETFGVYGPAPTTSGQRLTRLTWIAVGC